MLLLRSKLLESPAIDNNTFSIELVKYGCLTYEKATSNNLEHGEHLLTQMFVSRGGTVKHAMQDCQAS
jgi:hypothetical protein